MGQKHTKNLRNKIHDHIQEHKEKKKKRKETNKNNLSDAQYSTIKKSLKRIVQQFNIEPKDYSHLPFYLNHSSPNHLTNFITKILKDIDSYERLDISKLNFIEFLELKDLHYIFEDWIFLYLECNKEKQIKELNLFQIDFNEDNEIFKSLLNLENSLENSLQNSLQNLTEINIANNNFVNVEFLNQFLNLEKLNISGNYLENVVLENLKNLQSIYFSYNFNLQKIPKFLNEQKYLKNCKLNSCYISDEISLQFFDNLLNIEMVDLSNNLLNFTKEENDNNITIIKIPLEILNLQNNKITHLPESLFKKFTNLKNLNLSNNEIKELPNSFCNLINLEYLNLQNNQLENLPNNFSNLIKLNILILNNNKFEILNNEIFKLNNLKEFYANNNKIFNLENIQQWPELNILSLAGNSLQKLNYLPKTIKKLNIGFNYLTEINNIFEQIDKLQVLIASGNEINEIPLNILNISEYLKILYISHNNIKDIKMIDFTKLIKLEHLNLSGNLLENLKDTTFPSSLKYLNLELNYLTEEYNNSDITKFKEYKFYPQINNNNTNETTFCNVVFADCNGTYRPRMEDAHLIEENVTFDDKNYISFFGIFDGHAGSNVANYVANNLISIARQQTFPNLENNLENDNLTNNLDKLKEWLELIILQIEKQCEMEDRQIMKDGCTLVVGCIINQEYFLFGNVGDARVIIGKKQSSDMIDINNMDINKNVYRISHDHKPTTIEEMKRIKGIGGMIVNDRVQGQIGVSRSIGDFQLKPFVSNQPFINGFTKDELTSKIFNEIIISKDKENNEKHKSYYIVFGCDGVWDVLSDELVIEQLNRWTNERKKRKEVLASLLRDYAHALESTDNISVMIVTLTI